jgi:hypothetical protein
MFSPLVGLTIMLTLVWWSFVLVSLNQMHDAKLSRVNLYGFT